MFNFYIILAGHEKLSDADRVTTYGPKFKAPSLKQKVQKMKDLPKTWVLTGQQLEVFKRKKEEKHYSRPFEKS